MYNPALIAHSWLRWIVLVAAFGATMATLTDRPVVGEDSRMDRGGLALVTMVDFQMLLGLLLYLVVSPMMAAIRQDFALAMHDRSTRFWAVEHISLMFGVVILAHLGRVLARKAVTPETKRRRLLVCFGLATLLMLAGTPWPGMAVGRPLFRF